MTTEEFVHYAMIRRGDKHARHARHGVAAVRVKPEFDAAEVDCRCGERGIVVTKYEAFGIPIKVVVR
jgi:hypothetical protein